MRGDHVTWFQRRDHHEGHAAFRSLDDYALIKARCHELCARADALSCHLYASDSELSSIEAIDPRKPLIFHINDVEDRPKETIQDAHRLLPGEGVIPLDDILYRLKRNGFDGLCSIELCRPDYWGRDPAELAIAVRTATTRVLEPYVGVD